MEFSKKKLPASKLEVEVSISPEEVEAKSKEALSLFQKELSVEGFRKGRAPEETVRERIGKERIFAKAAELSIQEAYLRFLREENPEVLGEPEIKLVEAQEGKPLVFRMSLSLFPAVQLPQYKEIASRVERKQAKVQPEDVEKTLQWLRESRKKEDGTVPELTDEFAQSLGRFPDAGKLKESVQEGLLLEKELEERNRVRQEIVEKVAQAADLELPEVLVRQEQEALLEQTKQGIKQMLQMDFSEYLQSVKKSEEELKQSLLSQAEKRIRQFLVLGAIAKQEQIVPTPEEVDEETQKVLRQYEDPRKTQERFDPQELRLYSEGVVKNEKTLRFLEQFAQSIPS